MIITEAKFINLGTFPAALLKKINEFLKIHYPEKRSVRPFRMWPDLYSDFQELIIPYKTSRDITGYKQKLKELKKSFQIRLRPERKEHGTEASADDRVITLFNDFFKLPKSDKVSALEHELTHIIQYMFVDADVDPDYDPDDDETYFNDPHEIEAISKDIVDKVQRELRNKKGNMRDAKRLILNNKHFMEFRGKKNKRKAYQKIMKALFPVIESVYEDLEWEIENEVVTTRFQAEQFIKSSDDYLNLEDEMAKVNLINKVMGDLDEKRKLNSLTEQLNELFLPTRKVAHDDVLMRKLTRKEHIEDTFIHLFFKIIKSFDIYPVDFIDRYHKYVTERETKKKKGREKASVKAKRQKNISIAEIRDFISFIDSEESHQDVVRVLKIPKSGIPLLQHRLEVDLLDRVKRIMRGTSRDETHAGVSHVMDVEKRYNSMRIENINKRWKVRGLMRGED